MSQDPREPAVRVSDAERQLVDRRLQQALGEGRLTLGEYEERTGLVWAARTHADLAPLTADLPVAEPPLAAQVAWPPVPAPHSRWALAVLGDTEVVSAPEPGQVTKAIAVLGHAVVDLRGSALPPVVEIRASALLGSVQVLVPAGVRVELSGVALLGGKTARLAAAVVGAPLVRVRVVALLAQVHVRHERESGLPPLPR